MAKMLKYSRIMSRKLGGFRIRTKIVKALIICLIAGSITFLWANRTYADWQVGNYRDSTNGVTALIFTPGTRPFLIEAGSSGQANWVSTLVEDINGKDWLQAGWRYYYWDAVPKHYYEYCIDCQIEGLGTYYIDDSFATQTWGTVVDYWIIWDGNQRWCAYTASIQRECVDNLHTAPALVLGKSEVHNYLRNELDTTFDQVRYKDSANNWRLFDQSHFNTSGPYRVEIYSNYHYRTYRISTHEIYLPTISK